MEGRKFVKPNNLQRWRGNSPTAIWPPFDDDDDYIPRDFLLQAVLIWESFGQMPPTSAKTASTVTLNQIKAGCDVRISTLSGPNCDRLRDLGFCEELQLRKISGGRNLICSICGIRMAISRELAEQVLVCPVG